MRHDLHIVKISTTIFYKLITFVSLLKIVLFRFWFLLRAWQYVEWKKMQSIVMKNNLGRENMESMDKSQV